MAFEELSVANEMLGVEEQVEVASQAISACTKFEYAPSQIWVERNLRAAAALESLPNDTHRLRACIKALNIQGLKYQPTQPKY
jgi:hypothetical protein